MSQFIAAPAAVPAPSSRPGSQARQYLTFLVGSEPYGLDILCIKEIIEYRHASLTPVPLAPPFILGVINLRGVVVPVIDLAVRLNRPSVEDTPFKCIVIVEVESEDECQILGMTADGVNEVVELAAADIEPAPTFGANIRHDFIAGMGKLGGDFVVLLEIDKVLSVDEMARLGD
jgi:purine-binding chemotaxis protein CheW